ncbi:MAG: hypothetical protein WCI87_07730 [Euryarchaeota archaeon]
MGVVHQEPIKIDVQEMADTIQGKVVELCCDDPEGKKLQEKVARVMYELASI